MIKINFRLPLSLKQDLQRRADESNRTLSGYLVHVLTKLVRKHSMLDSKDGVIHIQNRNSRQKKKI